MSFTPQSLWNVAVSTRTSILLLNPSPCVALYVFVSGLNTTTCENYHTMSLYGDSHAVLSIFLSPQVHSKRPTIPCVQLLLTRYIARRIVSVSPTSAILSSLSRPGPATLRHFCVPPDYPRHAFPGAQGCADASPRLGVWQELPRRPRHCQPYATDWVRSPVSNDVQVPLIVITTEAILSWICHTWPSSATRAQESPVSYKASLRYVAVSSGMLSWLMPNV